MNGRQRELIIERDGFQCVHCRIVGKTCPLRGKQTEPCKLLSPALGAAKYFRMERLRPPFQLLQVDHIYGRVGGIEKTEKWDDVVTLCPCCHRAKGSVKRISILYAEQFKDKETPEYLAALADEAKDAPKRKAKASKTRRKLREKTKEKLGGAPRSKKLKPAAPSGKPPGMTTRDWEQRQRPVLNTALR